MQGQRHNKMVNLVTTSQNLKLENEQQYNDLQESLFFDTGNKEEDDRKSFIQGLWLTVILGFCFTLLQIYEYQHASFSFSDHIYGSVFYMSLPP